MSTTNFLSVLNVPRPLTYWHGQGGVYVGIKATPKGDLFHLIAAIGKHILKPQAWGPNKIKGASSYFDGFANTNSMAKGGSGLAKQVRALDIDGHKDWFIPSQADGNLLTANAAHLLGQDWYWLSTKYTGPLAWVQDMGQRNQVVSETSEACRVIPVRAIRIA